MTDQDYEIAEEVPTDEEGHPIHPERGHRICGAVKSDRSTPAPHGRSRDDFEYCLQPAGWGTEGDVGACKNHPYKGSQIGEANPNFKHGATSEYFKSKLSPRQKEVFDEWVDSLDDPEDAANLLGMVGMNIALRGEHAMDASMIREGRQILETFNIVDNTDKVEMDAHVESETEHSLDDDTKGAIRDVLSRRREGTDE